MRVFILCVALLSAGFVKTAPQKVTPVSSQQATLKQIGKGYDLLFFYASYCPYSKRLAKELPQFAGRNGFRLYSYSVNNKKLPELRHLRVDMRTYEDLDVEGVPVVAIRSKNYPWVRAVCVGYTPQHELAKKIIHAARSS